MRAKRENASKKTSKPFAIACVIPLILFAVVLLFMQNVSAQAAVVQITNVDAPASVAAGQELTVAVTISFHLEYILTVNIAVVSSAEGGAPYPTSVVSGSPFSCAVSTTSVCNLVLPFDTLQGNTTASFTFIAPSQVGAWSPVAVVYVGSSLVDSKAMPVTLTQPIPETPFPSSILAVAFIVATCLVRKGPRGHSSSQTRRF